MNPNIEATRLNLFLLVYFYLLEQDLNSRENALGKIKFQSEEANTDEYLKRYFQKYLLSNNSIRSTILKYISLIVDSEKFSVEVAALQNFEIMSVLLPEQLSDEQKQQIAASKKSVYTNPDLFLQITDGENIFFESLELKSTKSNNISGSSVQQVNPFEWVIFVKRNGGNVTVSTGHYINSITEKLPFPDRSPRPQIGFNTLQDWNRKYRKTEDGLY
ncbi:MAG: hypothetical protein R3E32_25875 [Chitinophagales bacterium]